MARAPDAHGDLTQPPTTFLRRNIYFDTVVFPRINWKRW